MMTITRKTLLVVVACAFAACASVSTHAQVLPAAGSFEIAFGVGVTNLTNVNNNNVSGILQAQVSYNATQKDSIGFEYAYVPLGSVDEGGGVTASEHLQNYGVLLRSCIFNAKYVMPYVVVAGGGASLTAKASSGGETDSATQSGGYFGFGGGINAPLGHGFGVRPELRYERQQLASTTVNGEFISGGGKNEIVFTGSIFYTFGGRGHSDYSSSHDH